MIGLNLTHQALATPEVLERIRALPGEPARAVAGWMAFFGGRYERVHGEFAPPVHDPCTVALLIDPTPHPLRRQLRRGRDGGPLDARRHRRRPQRPPRTAAQRARRAGARRAALLGPRDRRARAPRVAPTAAPSSARRASRGRWRRGRSCRRGRPAVVGEPQAVAHRELAPVARVAVLLELVGTGDRRHGPDLRDPLGLVDRARRSASSRRRPPRARRRRSRTAAGRPASPGGRARRCWSGPTASPVLRLLLSAGTTVSLAQLRSRFQAPQPPIDWRVQPLSG